MTGASLRSRVKLIALVLPVVFTVGFINSWNAGWGFVLFLLILPATALILLVGIGASLVQDVVSKDRWQVRLKRGGVTLAVACLVVGSSWPVLALGASSGSLTRLAINVRTYRTIISELRAHPDQVERIERKFGVTLAVDRGPPLRVAFNPEGMLDNWSGIVFDPTGEMMQADGFDASGRFRAPERITRLFGGDLMSCRRLCGDYYDCSFT